MPRFLQLALDFDQLEMLCFKLRKPILNLLVYFLLLKHHLALLGLQLLTLPFKLVNLLCKHIVRSE